MRTKIIIPIILAIVLATAGLAFSLEAEPVKNTIELKEVATYNLTITNDGDSKESYSIKAPGAELDWTVIPVFQADVPAGESMTILLQLTPKALLSTGRYHILDIEVKSTKTDDSERVPVKIFIKAERGPEKQYEPDVLINTFMRNKGGEDGKIDPSKEIAITLDMTNRNTRNITALLVRLISPLFDQPKEVYTSLEPEQSKQEIITFNIDPLTQPQPAVLDIELILGGEEAQFYEAHKNIDVLGVPKEFMRETSFENYFLKHIKTIKLTNEGNVERTEPVEEPTSFWESIFTNTNPSAYTLKKEGTKFHVWDTTLEPDGTTTVTKTVNYRPALIVAIIIFLLVLVYYIMKPAVTLTKTTTSVGKSEGGLSELKVMLHIKNISPKPVRNVMVHDTVPSLAQFVRDESLGTLQPKKVKSYEKRGVVAEWEIPSLEGNEERIISYKIKSRLSILGHFKLPNASVKYDAGKRRRESVSNSVKVENN